MEQPQVDYRFILANERTFLAWMRTALGLVAGGVALDQFVAIDQRSWAIGVIAVVTVFLGAAVALIGIYRWRNADVAMHEGVSIPRSNALLITGVGFTALALIIALALIFLR
ncbi:MAG: DUF202 domain-containing protein [Actinobacteria bacterium]|nr:DUF202 domain-containing protein [Actinomycetota bacterium]